MNSGFLRALAAVHQSIDSDKPKRQKTSNQQCAGRTAADRLAHLGWSRRRIADEAGLDVGTVGDVLRHVSGTDVAPERCAHFLARNARSLFRCVNLGGRTHPLIGYDRKIIANAWTTRLTYT